MPKKQLMQELKSATKGVDVELILKERMTPLVIRAIESLRVMHDDKECEIWADGIDALRQARQSGAWKSSDPKDRMVMIRLLKNFDHDKFLRNVDPGLSGLKIVKTLAN